MPAFGDLLRVDELFAMIRVKAQYTNVKVNLRDDQEDLKFCYDILTHVSRSFAAVIIQLNEELRDAVCLFYLVLRGLDTVEDDMSVAVSVKEEILPKFHEKLQLPDWHIDGIGKGKERTLLEEFYRVSRECQKLKPEYLEVISDICHKMALGMVHFLKNEVVVKADYDLYCHYVAGLVGHGLTRLFASSGLEDPAIAKDLRIANSMGLFLQKANIIRDYYEDIVEEPPRMFWPKEIWGNYAEKLADLKPKENKQKAVECLNAMVADALQHLPECVDYMASLKEQSVIFFCAIPQVMAIATLAQLHNNAKVFTEKVKIRKGLACKIIRYCDTLPNALRMFLAHVAEIESTLQPADPSYPLLKERLAVARSCIEAQLAKCTKKQSVGYARAFLMSFPALGGQLLYSVIDSISGLFGSAPKASKRAQAKAQ
jgi:farnesyl-diphosphate farnesyltransferase